MAATYGTIHRLLTLAAVSTIVVNAESPPLRCPRLCQCSNERQYLTILCSDIRLDHFPVDIPKTVKSLDVSSNSISYVFYKDLRFPLLKYLDISSNNIQDVSSDTFSGLTLLKELDLSFNKITRFHPSTFIQNRILTHLSIRGNPLLTADDSPVLTSDSLRSLELDLSTWSKHTFEKLTTLERLTVHWKKGISISSTTFEPLYRLRELNIICTEVCDKETVALSPDLKNNFARSGVKIVFNITTGKQVAKQDIDSNEEGELNQEVTVAPSSPRQGAEEVQNDTPHISGPVAGIIPVPADEGKISDQKDSTLTSSTQQATNKIENVERVNNKFSGLDSSTIFQSIDKGREIYKEQAPEYNENKIQIPEKEKMIIAATGVIIVLLILILTLIVYITMRWYRQNRARVSHKAPTKPVPGNAHFLEKAVPYDEHVYDEPKNVDSRLFYHIYYDHNAPLLPHRPHLRPPVPPRPVGYYAVAYEGERR